MIKEDKDLVYKDISARLPYDVIVHVSDPSTRTHDTYLHEAILARFGNNQAIVRPYLRSMSSMTEEERKYFQKLAFPYDFVDALNKHHFDYRGLIPKGLAIEVTEENNPYK